METFVVRVVPPTDEAGNEHLHGVVRHIASGAETAFSQEDDLVAFVRRLADAETRRRAEIRAGP